VAWSKNETLMALGAAPNRPFTVLKIGIDRLPPLEMVVR